MLREELFWTDTFTIHLMMCHASLTRILTVSFLASDLFAFYRRLFSWNSNFFPQNSKLFRKADYRKKSCPNSVHSFDVSPLTIERKLLSIVCGSTIATEKQKCLTRNSRCFLKISLKDECLIRLIAVLKLFVSFWDVIKFILLRIWRWKQSCRQFFSITQGDFWYDQNLT